MQVASSKGLAAVTGAAGGLGSSFAKKLAERGYRLLLVDRRQGPLEEVRETLVKAHGITVETYVADLCKREEVERLAMKLAQIADLELLVNNAGFGTVDYFADTDISYLVGQVDLHVVTPTILTRAVLPGMIERNRGNIINVSSIGAWFHSAGNVQYGSTKNFLATFSQSLQQELRDTNVRVQALCPGFVRTGFHAADCMKAFKLRRSPAEHMWMTADEVVDCSLSKLSSKEVVVVPGFIYRIVSRLARMPFVQPLMQRITRAPRSVAKPSVQHAQPEPVFGIIPKKA